MTSDLAPILTGDYIELRPLPEDDLPRLLKVYQGTPLYFDGLGDRADRLTLDDVRAQWQRAQERRGGRCSACIIR